MLSCSANWDPLWGKKTKMWVRKRSEAHLQSVYVTSILGSLCCHRNPAVQISLIGWSEGGERKKL